jgi:CRP-like cAMP-binding protein
MNYAVPSHVWSTLPELRLAAGDVLLEAGEPTREMFVLESGALDVMVDGTVLARVDTPGSVVGEMAGLLDLPRNADVVARTAVVCRVVDDVTTLFRTSPEAGLAVARILAHRLHLLDAFLVDLKSQYVDRADGLLGMLDDLLGALAGTTPVDVEPGSDREPEPNDDL